MKTYEVTIVHDLDSREETKHLVNNSSAYEAVKEVLNNSYKISNTGDYVEKLEDGRLFMKTNSISVEKVENVEILKEWNMLGMYCFNTKDDEFSVEFKDNSMTIRNKDQSINETLPRDRYVGGVKDETTIQNFLNAL